MASWEPSGANFGPEPGNVSTCFFVQCCCLYVFYKTFGSHAGARAKRASALKLFFESFGTHSTLVARLSARSLSISFSLSLLLSYFLSVSLTLALDVCLLVLAYAVRVFALFARLALLSLLKSNVSKLNALPVPMSDRFSQNRAFCLRGVHFLASLEGALLGADFG